VLGSVAATVVRRAQLPVLLSRPDILVPSRPVEKILVALEGPEPPKDLLGTVKGLARTFSAELVLCHVAPKVEDPSPQWATETPLSLRSRPEHYLQELADRLEAEGLTAWPSVVSGEPVEKILEQIDKHNVDLVALATHGRSGLERWVTGSVAEGVLRNSPVPVLLQKPLVVHRKPALMGESHD
jgi:nucleotide-binding universal stress UspA family protein